MNSLMPKLIITSIVICMVIIFAVCMHSIEEIHYLKSFFPQQFTVEQAFYASAIELIKIIIICIPLLIIINTGYRFLNCHPKNR